MRKVGLFPIQHCKASYATGVRSNKHLPVIGIHIYASVKGHLEPTHLKSSPLFTFSTKLLGQDSPSIHLFSKIMGSRFTTAKIKLGEDSSS